MKVKVKLKARPVKAAERIEIETEFIKLDSFLKFSAAVGTGGEAKILITEGEVKINGECCTQRGKKLVPGDIVELMGQRYEVAAAEKE